MRTREKKVGRRKERQENARCEGGEDEGKVREQGYRRCGGRRR